MYFLVALLPMLLLSVSSARLLRRSVFETFAPSLFSIALIVYLCGLLGVLSASHIVVISLALVLLVIDLFHVRKGKATDEREPFFSFGLILILVGSLCILLFTRGRMVTDMDSFEQWAYIVKKMYLTSSLQSAIGQYASTALYPPGIALIQYYFMRFSPAFDESLLFAARNLLVFSLFLPFFERLNWKKWIQVLLIGLILLIFPFMEYASFDTSLGVDAILGLLFGWVLIKGSEKEKIDGFWIISLALGGFLLALSKVSGMAFVAIAAAVLLFSKLWNSKVVPLQLSDNRNMRGAVLPSLVLLAGGVIAFVSWYLFVKASRVATSSSSLSFAGGLLQYQKETIVNFMYSLFAYDGVGFSALSPVAWLFAVPFAGAVVTLLLSREESRSKQVVPLTLLISLGYFVWLGVLLIGYLTSFIPQEAVSLAAFSRYLSSYQIGVSFLVLFWITRAFESRGELFYRRLLALLVCLIAALAPLDDVFFATVGSHYQNDKSVEFRARYAPASRYYAELTGANVKICYLDQTEQEPGYSFALFQFEALPIRVEKAIAWRLGGPYYEKDYYSASPTAEEWERALIDGRFTHLYLRNTNSYFEQVYGALFADVSDIQADSYYAIVQQNGHIQLTRILLQD